MRPLAGFGRHLRGWQLAVVAVGTALGALALSVPRPVAPRELPLPTVDREEERVSAERSAAMVRAAKATPLPFLVRAAGEAFRRFGAAEAKGDERERDAQRLFFSRRIAAAREKYGDAPVLALRAVQADLFVRAVREGNATDLSELGGGFFRNEGGDVAKRAAALDDDELASLFVMRWTKLGRLAQERAFAPTLNEWRLYYRTLLLHADLANERYREDPRARAFGLARCIDSLTKIDPDYPKLLGLGIVEYWMGHYDAAQSLFAERLRSHPSGPWRLRAQGYLLAARRASAAAGD